MNATAVPMHIYVATTDADALDQPSGENVPTRLAWLMALQSSPETITMVEIYQLTDPCRRKFQID